MESCYIPNNPQFGISLEYTTYNGGFAGYGHLTACDTGQQICCESEIPCSCAPSIDVGDLREFRDCECQNSCEQNLNELNNEGIDQLGIEEDNEAIGEVNNDIESGQSAGPPPDTSTAYWTSEDMGSFSLPSLDLEPLPSLFPFSPCSGNYNRSSAAAAAECRDRGAEAADVLLSLKHAAAVHGDYTAETQHPQMMVSPPGNTYPYYEQYAAPPLFPTMSVNVSMNMTMHGYPADQMCPQMQWNQSPPAVNMCPQSQVISPTYPGATYSFTADFRANQSDPLITATSSFKPLQIPPPPTKPNYGLFPKQQAYSNLSQKPLGQAVSFRCSSSGHPYQPLPQQSHPPDYYPSCVSAGKVQVGSLSGCSEDDDQKPNLCRICGKTYARPSTLKTHLRTHSGERPYRCVDCNKSFSQAANLTAHVRTHTGQKPFRCPICDRRFSQSSSVTTHMRTHSGERPYRCRACKKAFSDSSTLTKHLRIHSGEKPYQCKLCLLRFSQSGNLNRHMRVHGNNAALLG